MNIFFLFNIIIIIFPQNICRFIYIANKSTSEIPTGSELDPYSSIKNALNNIVDNSINNQFNVIKILDPFFENDLNNISFELMEKTLIIEYFS